ncbi:hypothetical protein DXG01_012809 [Tephrocybe rancida]|nr:hypothetical protein DXG01_012809 [Tephrocybe rancida]
MSLLRASLGCKAKPLKDKLLNMNTSYSAKTNNPLVISNLSVIRTDVPNVDVNSAVPVNVPNVSHNTVPVANPSGSSVPATSEQGVPDIQHQHTEGLFTKKGISSEIITTNNNSITMRRYWRPLLGAVKHADYMYWYAAMTPRKLHPLPVPLNERDKPRGIFGKKNTWRKVTSEVAVLAQLRHPLDDTRGLQLDVNNTPYWKREALLAEIRRRIPQ